MEAVATTCRAVAAKMARWGVGGMACSRAKRWPGLSRWRRMTRTTVASRIYTKAASYQDYQCENEHVYNKNTLIVLDVNNGIFCL